MAESYNPYAPPSEEGGGTRSIAPTAETVIPRVFGILSVIFSSITLVVVLFGMLIGFAAYRFKTRAHNAPAEARASSADLQRAERAEAGQRPGAKKARARPTRLQDAAGGTVAGAWLLGPPLLLIIGIGQLRYRRWARLFTLLWSGLMILAMVAFVVLGAAGGSATDDLIASAVFAIISSVYPMLMLIFFSRPNVAAAMVG